MKGKFRFLDLPDRVECGNVECSEDGRRMWVATRLLVGLSVLVWVFIWLM